MRPTRTTTIACLIRSQDKVFEKTAGSRHTSPATASVERIEVTRYLSTAVGVKAILISPRVSVLMHLELQLRSGARAATAAEQLSRIRHRAGPNPNKVVPRLI